MKNQSKKIFTPKEFDLLFYALDVFATEIHDCWYNGHCDQYGKKREVDAKLKAIKALETKLENL